MLKNKFFWIAIILIIVGVGGGYWYYTTKLVAAPTASAATSSLQTTTARIGDITLAASGAGALTAAEQISLGFEENGTLMELCVSVGSHVDKGQVLARLQTSNSQENINASIADAELSVLNAQKSLDDLHANAGIARTNAMTDINTYVQAVRDAQYTLENYTMPVYLQGLDAIEAVDLMKEKLDAASAAFEPYRLYPASHETRQALLTELNTAQSQFDAAVKRLNYELVLEVATANLEKARAEYEKYKEGPAVDELSIATAELTNAKAKLALAREAKAIDELVSPMDATVMSIEAQVGESAGTAAFITLANLKQPMVEVYLDETDLDKIAVGNLAEVIFDALPDQIFTGKVITVDPSLVTVGGYTTIRVVVQLEDFKTEQTLPVGSNASVDVIGGQSLGAVLVPVEALREIDQDEYAVFVMVDGQLKLRKVEVGLIDVTFAEIISGLQAGETISTGIVRTQ